MDSSNYSVQDLEIIINSFEAGKDVSDLAEENVESLDLKQENNEYLDLRNLNIKYESSLRKHLIKHTSEGSQNCKICNKVSKNRSSLRKHLII